MAGALRDGLSDREELFVHYYIQNGGNAAAAAHAAGYASRQGTTQMMRRPAIAAAIKRGRVELLARVDFKTEQTRAEAVVIASDRTLPPRDRIAALTLIARIDGILSETNINVTVTLTPEQRRARVVELLNEGLAQTAKALPAGRATH